MKKTLVMLLLSGLLLVGCNNKKDISSSNSSSTSTSSSVSTEYTQDQVRNMFENDLFRFNTNIKEQTKFNINGEFEAPDLASTGLYNYKFNADADISSILGVPNFYMRTSVKTYGKEDGVVNKEPTSSIELIRKPVLTDVYDYVLEKNGKYTQTIDRGGNLVFTPGLQAILDALRQVTFDDLPRNAHYTYENKIYGISFKLKDIEGTKISEYLNLLLGLFPEVNEKLSMYKNKVVIDVTNINFSMKNTKCKIAIKYPMMEGMYIDAISGFLNIKYDIKRVDTSKLDISDTYYIAKNGTNTFLPTMLKEETIGEDKHYKGYLVLTPLLGIEIDTEKPSIEGLGRKTFQIESKDAISIKYYNRFTGEKLKDIKDNKVTIDMFDVILISFSYKDITLNHDVVITDITETL